MKLTDKQIAVQIEELVLKKRELTKAEETRLDFLYAIQERRRQTRR